jgi:hypothetical protein
MLKGLVVKGRAAKDTQQLLVRHYNGGATGKKKTRPLNLRGRAPSGKIIWDQFQSAPRGLPSPGVQALNHVVVLIEGETLRQLPSPRAMFIVPV